MFRIPDIGWTAVSGSRAKKFSIHAVCKRFLVERSSESMKLLEYEYEYEIAKPFALEN
jgi:hypothetical protein